jgi:hypothetical protein
MGGDFSSESVRRLRAWQESRGISRHPASPAEVMGAAGILSCLRLRAFRGSSSLSPLWPYAARSFRQSDSRETSPTVVVLLMVLPQCSYFLFSPAVLDRAQNERSKHSPLRSAGQQTNTMNDSLLIIDESRSIARPAVGSSVVELGCPLIGSTGLQLVSRRHSGAHSRRAALSLVLRTDWFRVALFFACASPADSASWVIIGFRTSPRGDGPVRLFVLIFGAGAFETPS